MGCGCDHDRTITDRQRAPNEAAQHIHQESVVGIQLNDMAVVFGFRGVS